MIQHDQGATTASLEALGDLFFSAPARRRPQKSADQPKSDDKRRHHDAPAAPIVSAAPSAFIAPATPAALAVPPSAVHANAGWRPLDDCDLGRQGSFCQKISRGGTRNDKCMSLQAERKSDFRIPRKLEIDLLVLLAGGLPPCGRLRAAWAALRRLSPEDGRTLVLTITDSAAWLQRCGRWEDCHAHDDNDDGGNHGGDLHRRFEQSLADADGLVIIAADPTAALVRAVTLPAARIVLAEGGKDGVIAAYCELKAAALDAQPAELFVIDGDDGRQAEQVYRRLAQVAISHLEMSPTFAGHARRLADTDCPGAAGDAGEILPLTLDQADQLLSAAAIDRHPHDGIDPLDLPGEAPPLPAAPPRRNPQPEALQDDKAEQRPVSRKFNDLCDPDWPMSGLAADASQTPPPPPAQPPQTPDEPPTPPVPPAPPDRRNLPVGQGDFQNFSVWLPQSRDELLEAVRAALPAALPQIANMFDPKDLADEADLPDLLVFDASGAVAGLVASLDGSADDAARAVAAADWLRRYARLLSRACCEIAATGETAAGAAGDAVMIPPVWLLVPQQHRKASQRLNLPEIGLLTWQGASFGGSRGVIIEHCGNWKSQDCRAARPPQRHETASSGALLPTSAPRAVRVEHGLAVSLVQEQEPWSQTADDDGLTRDELEALKKNLKIEEMT